MGLRLNDRQVQIIQAVLAGNSWTETAQIVGCHKATVEYTLKRLRIRLGYKNNQALLVYLRVIDLTPKRIVSSRGIRQLKSGKWQVRIGHHSAQSIGVFATRKEAIQVKADQNVYPQKPAKYLSRPLDNADLDLLCRIWQGQQVTGDWICTSSYDSAKLNSLRLRGYVEKIPARTKTGKPKWKLTEKGKEVI